MSNFRFWLFVLRHGSFFNKPINFKRERFKELENLPNYKIPKETFYSSVRDWFASMLVIGPIIENIAYWKKLDRIHKNFFCVDTLQLTYIRILKSASTSVLKELLPKMDEQLRNLQCSDSQIDQLAASYVVHQITGDRMSYSTFSIVRNPFHRLVSVYRDLFNSGSRDFAYRNYLFGVLKHNMSFNEFVRVLSVIPTQYLASHFAAQSKIISDCGDMNQFQIFRLEKDKEQLNTFLSKFNVELSHSNKASEYDHRSYYDPETTELAFTLYKDDVDKLGYEEEYQSLLNYVKNRI